MTVQHRTLEASVATLVALLNNDQLPKVIGLDEVPTLDKGRLLVSCAADLIVHLVVEFAGHDQDGALQGLEALHGDMVRHVERLTSTLQ